MIVCIKNRESYEGRNDGGRTIAVQKRVMVKMQRGLAGRMTKQIDLREIIR